MFTEFTHLWEENRVVSAEKSFGFGAVLRFLHYWITFSTEKKCKKQVLVDAQQQVNRKYNFGPDLGLLGSNLGHNFFLKVSPPKLQSSSISRKATMQPWENGKNPNFGPNLPLPPPPRFVFVSFNSTSYTLFQAIILGKLMNQTWENGKKIFGPDFDPFSPNSGHQNIFFMNLASSVPKYHGQLSSCTISEKTTDPILRKVSDGRTNGDGGEWFHRTLSD